jgi:ankyrin repeat protein
LQKGADVNGRDKGDLTLLLVAAHAKGSLPIVRELLKYEKLDVNATNDDGDTALLCASRYGNLDVVLELLKDERVEVNA